MPSDRKVKMQNFWLNENFGNCWNVQVCHLAPLVTYYIQEGNYGTSVTYAFLTLGISLNSPTHI